MKRIKNPRVSIGMPVFNGERYIAETLDSLLSQTFYDFEIIISDNASMDQTEQICRSYTENDKRICYIRNETNLGAAKNYRRTFELSSGEYFRWANCDDLFAPESLARCVEVLDSDSSVILAYPKTKLIDDQGRIISDHEDHLHLQSAKASDRFIQVYSRLGIQNVIYGLIRSDLLKRTSLMGNFIASDRPFVAELALYGKFHEIPEFLFFRRIHSGAYSSQKKSAELIAFYNPRKMEQIPLIRWRHLWENFRAIIRAPLNIAEKIRLFSHVVRMGKWFRHELSNEIFATLRWIVHRM